MTLRTIVASLVVAATSLGGLVLAPAGASTPATAGPVNGQANRPVDGRVDRVDAGRSVSLSGVLVRYAATTRNGGDHVLHGLRTELRTYLLEADGPLPAVGTRVEVEGSLHEGTVTADTVRVLGSPAPRTAPRAGAPRSTRVLALRVYWTKQPPKTPSTTQAKRAMISKPDEWFDEVSHGRYSISGTVTPWLRIKAPRQCFDPNVVMERALAAARNRGFDLGDYGRYIVYEPCSAGGIAGLAAMPGKEVWLFGDLSLGVNVHEQGHNLGLDHANARLCKQDGSQVTWSGRCSVLEYGDPSDVMGNTTDTHYNGYFKSRLGWLQKGRTLKGSTSTVTLTAAEKTGPGVKAVRVKASRKRSYWLELRGGTGFDSQLVDGGRGLQVRLQSGRGSQLLDLMPRSKAGFEGDRYVGEFDRMALPEGSGWTSPEGIRISLLSVSSDRAEVRVAWGAGTPTAPDAPGPVLAAPLEDGADVSWQRPDDNGATILRYVVTASPGKVEKVVQTAGGLLTSTRLTGLAPGVEHTVTVRAVNEVGTGPAATAKVTPLSLGPSVAITSPGTGAAVTGVVAVTGDVAPHPDTGDPVVGVQLYVDGEPDPDAWDGTAPWSVDFASGTVSNGGHTLQLRATAGTGQRQRSTMSAPVQVVVQNPTLSITSPTAGATLSRTSRLTYQVQDRGSWSFDRVVARVGGPDYLYDVGESADDGTIDIDVTAVPNGTRRLVLIATDPVRGELRTAQQVTVTNPAPALTVTSPTAGQTLTTAHPEIGFSSSPADWPWDDLEVRLGGQPVGWFDGERLVADLSEVPNGTYNLRVAGTWGGWMNTTVSDPVPVTVALPARAVTFSGPPAAGSTVSGTVQVPFDVTPDDWPWQEVTLEVKDQWGSFTVAWSDAVDDGQLAWDTTWTENGTAEIRLVARDDGWQEYPSPWRSVTISN